MRVIFVWFDLDAGNTLETPRHRRGRFPSNLDSRDKTPIQSLCDPQTIPKLRNSCSRLKHLSKKSSTSRFRLRELKLSRFEHRSSRMDRSRPAALFHNSVPTQPPYGQYCYRIT